MDPPLPEVGRKRSRFDAQAPTAPSAAPVATNGVASEAVARAAAAAAAVAARAAAAAAAVAAPAATVPASAASTVAAAQQQALLRAQQLLGSFGIAPAYLPPSLAATMPPQATGTVPDESNRNKRTELPPPLVLDSQGRSVDAVSQLMNTPIVPVTTLKINAANRVAPADADKPVRAPRPKPAAAAGGAGASTGAAAAAAAASNPYLAHAAADGEGDGTRDKRSQRANRGLKFVAPGACCLRPMCPVLHLPDPPPPLPSPTPASAAASSAARRQVRCGS
jgi:hypothetical protein